MTDVYEARVQELVEQGMSRSDAQGIADNEEREGLYSESRTVDVDVSCPHCGEALSFVVDRSIVEYMERCDECDNHFVVDVVNETTRTE